MKRLSLRFRFLLLLIGLLLVVFTAITLTIVRQDSKTLKANLVDESKSFAALATQPIGSAFELYQDSGTLAIQQKVGTFTDLDPNINQVEVVNSSGQRVFTYSSNNQINVTASMVSGLDPTYIHDKQGNLVAIVQPYIEDYGIHSYAVVYGVSYTSVNQAIQTIVTYIVILSLVILLISLVGWYLLINQLFLRPVANVSHLALMISRGDLNQQIKLKRNDEIGDLATAVDTMASSLKGDIDKLKQLDTMKNEFMMITSHNLRTPLTIIEGYVDTMEGLDEMPQDVKEMLEPLSINVNRLRGFAEDVLTISTIEAGQDVLHLTPTEMAPLLKTIADEFAKLAKQKGITFQADITTNCQVNLSKPHFRSALWNLLDNAYKFTKEGGSIALIANDDGSVLEVSVRDTGTGIAASEVPKLFTKFHRGTDTLTYNYEGTGIGLYISKLVIGQHGGLVTVQSAEGAGSTFTISLPIIRSPQPETK